MTNQKTVAVICSLSDAASVNIKDNLLKIADWKPKELPTAERMKEALSLFLPTAPSEDSMPSAHEMTGTNLLTGIFELQTSDLLFRLIFLDGKHIFQDRLDLRLKHLNIPADLIIFASKHRSKSETRALTVHPTGNAGESALGGYPKALSIPMPLEMKKMILALNDLNQRLGLLFDVTMEVTHHGPTELLVPSMFAEIGSTENEWGIPLAGEIVAKSILSLSSDFDFVPMNDFSPLLSDPVFAVGFGGGHYAQRPTKYLFRTRLAFGHIFPKHQLEFLTEPVVKDAFLKTGANVAFFDKKSMKGDDRRRLFDMISAMGFQVLNDKEALAEFGLDEFKEEPDE
ncbi:D-aminoacyl-tRNA deacylase [Methanolapillus millepedarum]|uniref:D-aminoacyl-tRNA deacylase n=1 Tax=Methanolapillus millepedarum TaxID=3028296 RepID=A0AA96ZUW2_9EURY|nr:hypothetical protein MsAc7_16310 [Methanosarcinaceae archaeon Ac7]